MIYPVKKLNLWLAAAVIIICLGKLATELLALNNVLPFICWVTSSTIFIKMLFTIRESGIKNEISNKLGFIYLFFYMFIAVPISFYAFFEWLL